ncbi:MAG: hypothetical protein Q4G33_13490 [bacterium]|nr:hypothetical protein [bacterium]
MNSRKRKKGKIHITIVKSSNEDNLDGMLWCKRCGEVVGIYSQRKGGYVYDGNYCRTCGKRIEE